MALKGRRERLEQAAPKGGYLSVCWRSIVTRNGDVLTEAVHSSHIIAGPHGLAESHEGKPSNSEQVFVRHVLDRACIVHSRHDEAFREDIRWRSGSGTHLALRPEKQPICERGDQIV